jgi:signal transduction histidine kinase
MTSKTFGNKKYLLPVIFLAIALAGWTGGLIISLKNTNENIPGINKTRFEKELQKADKELTGNLTLLHRKADNDASSLPSLMNSLSGTDLSYFIYSKDTLTAWSDASIPITGSKQILFSQRVAHLKNGWYLIERRKHNDNTYIGLFRIKQQYEYENKFLKSHFSKRFRLASNPGITTDKDANGVTIVDCNGQYLFTLVSDPDMFINTKASKTVVLLIVIALIFSLLFIGSVTGYLIRRFGNYAFLIIIFILSAFYLGFVNFNTAFLADISELFSPVLFAYTSVFPSLFSLLFLAVILQAFFFWFYRYFQLPLERGKKRDIITFVISVTALLSYLIFVNRLLVIMVKHSSSVSLYYRVTDLDIAAITKITIITLLMFSFLIFAEKIIGKYSRKMPARTQALVFFIVALTGYALTSLTNTVHVNGEFILFIVVGLVLSLIHKKKKQLHSYNIFIWLILIFSFYVTLTLVDLYVEKEQKTRELLIENLSFRLVREEDPVAEMYLKGLEPYFENDDELKKMLAAGDFTSESIKQYLEKKYFAGYMSRYELQVIPCWPGGDLMIEETGEHFNCYNYFDDLISQVGDTVSGTNHFFFLDNNNGNVTYMGVFGFFTDDPDREVNLYIEINSKPVFIGLGYPELLKSNKERKIFEVDQMYSYAKYVNGHLTKQFGNYEYEVSSGLFENGSGEKYYVDTDMESHLVYRPEKNVLIVLSRSKISLPELVIGFSIFFITFFLLALTTLLLIKIKSGLPFFRLTIRERIQLALVGMVLLLLLIIGISSVYYSIYQFKKKNNEILSQRLTSVMMELEQKIGQEEKISPDMRTFLQPMLQEFSNVFFCDINLFDLDGHLAASSRPELYMKGLTGRLMSPKAFYEMSVTKRVKYKQTEHVGSLKYVSAYVTVLNNNNEPLAYLNIPYFVGSDDIREQVSSLIVAVINAYLIFVLIAISLAVFIAKRITYPLSMLQSRLEKVSLSQKNEKIGYKRQDEIGELVKVYNRMVDELASSAERLAQSERESAWREMAKQIAHEIKNPLTPMKLHIQYLQRAWKDNVDNFDEYLEKVTNSLIEQIDQLSVIATEFSNFAKMPVARRSKIDIVSKLQSTCSLYRKTPGLKIVENFDTSSPVWVYADPDQMVSVFNNLIKNAQQAIPKGREGILQVSLKTEDGKVLITFTDNGSGIPEDVQEKIFRPNFTTKSSGMGLGLAIVKNIITNSKGSIRFTTEKDKGTTFYIELPLMEE